VATHDVTITSIPRQLIGANDVVFEVKEDGSKLGDLKVSQGNIHWVPSGHTFGYTLEWHQFAEIAEKQGRRRKYIS